MADARGLLVARARKRTSLDYLLRLSSVLPSLPRARRRPLQARITASMATALEGKGAVPDIPLFGAVVKRLFELPTAKTFASNGLPVHWPAGFDFTADGLSAQVPVPHAQRPSRQLSSR